MGQSLTRGLLIPIEAVTEGDALAYASSTSSRSCVLVYGNPRSGDLGLLEYNIFEIGGSSI